MVITMTMGNRHWRRDRIHSKPGEPLPDRSPSWRRNRRRQGYRCVIPICTVERNRAGIGAKFKRRLGALAARLAIRLQARSALTKRRQSDMAKTHSAPPGTGDGDVDPGKGVEGRARACGKGEPIASRLPPVQFNRTRYHFPFFDAAAVLERGDMAQDHSADRPGQA